MLPSVLKCPAQLLTSGFTLEGEFLSQYMHAYSVRIWNSIRSLKLWMAEDTGQEMSIGGKFMTGI